MNLLPVLWIASFGLAVPNSVHAANPSERFLHDSARVLAPEAQTLLDQELRQFAQETGVRFYVKAITYLDPGVSMRTTSRTTRRELASTGPVALLLVDRGQNGISLSHSPDLWQRYPLARLVDALRAALAETQSNDLPLAAKMAACTHRWMAAIRVLESERHLSLRLLRDKEKNLLLAFAMLLATGGVGAVFFGSRDRARLSVENQRFLFPEVNVGQRLGAPFGGGHIVEWEASGTQ
jgi:hypothetical protein